MRLTAVLLGLTVVAGCAADDGTVYDETTDLIGDLGAPAASVEDAPKADDSPEELFTEPNCHYPDYPNEFNSVDYTREKLGPEDDGLYYEFRGYLGIGDVVDLQRFVIRNTTAQNATVGLNMTGTHQAEQAACLNVFAGDGAHVTTRHCVGYGAASRWTSVQVQPGDSVYLTLINNVPEPTDCNRWTAKVYFWNGRP